MFCQIVLHCVPFKLYICFFLHLFVFSDAHITFVCFVLHNFVLRCFCCFLATDESFCPALVTVSTCIMI